MAHKSAQWPWKEPPSPDSHNYPGGDSSPFIGQPEWAIGLRSGPTGGRGVRSSADGHEALGLVTSIVPGLHEPIERRFGIPVIDLEVPVVEVVEPVPRRDLPPTN